MTITARRLLDNKAVFEAYSRKSKNILAVNCFPNIFAWRDFFDFEFKIINNCLCVFARHSLGVFLYMPPLGEILDQDALDRCFRYMLDINGGKNVTRVENIDVYQQCLLPAVRYQSYLKGYEYCYFKQSIAGLQGNSYKSQRADKNHFLKNNEYEYLPYDASMKNDCSVLYGQWAVRKKQCVSDDIALAMVEENYCVSRNILTFFDELDMIGRVVKVNGIIKAYTFGYPVNSNTFCVYSEITDLNIQGLAAFIFSEFCRDAVLAPYAFINAMDDSGLVRLRETKMSFHPTHLWPVYCAKDL